VIGLVLSLILGILFFLAFLVLALAGHPKVADAAVPVRIVQEMIDLRGLAFANTEVLLRFDDYRKLRSRPDLREVARRFRADRREIVLLWLRSLGEDVKKLWRFRRLLVRSGVSVGLWEEVHIAVTASLVLLFLLGLRMLAVGAGPFVIGGLIRAARHLVERTSHSCAALLKRLPPGAWPELERKWANGLASED